MSGYRPQNTGNRGALRLGPGVTRRLRAAGINVSPAANKHVREGIYVSARGRNISVLVDLPTDAEAIAQEIAAIVKGWGYTPEVRKSTHDDGGITARVTFTIPDVPRETSPPVNPDK